MWRAFARPGGVCDTCDEEVPVEGPCFFPAYDGNPDNFLPWLVTVEERRVAHKLQDEVAIAYATHAIGSHARVTVDGVVFPDWGAFVSQLKKRFCSDSFEYNIAWRLNQLKV